MDISPDDIIFYSHQVSIFGLNFTANINMTMIGTWIILLFIGFALWLLTRNLNGKIKMTRLQNLMESLVQVVNSQIAQISQRDPMQFLVLIGSFFLFIFIANLSSIFPIYFYSSIRVEWVGYIPPTGSFSTTLAYSTLILLSVFYFGIRSAGIKGYFKTYVDPKPFLLPFNILSNISNTASLAIRLYGNIMSGGIIICILFALVPVFIPTVMQIYGVLTGSIQAYIFSVLGLVYISAGMGEITKADVDAVEKWTKINV